MAHTIIGMFDNGNIAQEAENELLRNGFSNDRVDLSLPYNEESNTSSYDDDSIANFFKSLFSDEEEESNDYRTVGSRNAMITVHADSYEEAERAARILDANGAIDVNERARSYGSGRSDYGRSNTGSSNVGSETSIPIMEENLEVGKRTVESGGVKLRSRIFERPVEEHLRLRKENVSVNRNRVNRPASEADFDKFKEGTYTATEKEEVPVVNKSARVTEEVNVRKDVSEHDETIRENVRKTDVDIENMEEEEHHHYEGDDRGNRRY